MASYNQCYSQLRIIDLNNKAATSISMKKIRRANDRLLEALEICSAGMKEQTESCSLSPLTGTINHEDGDNDDSSDLWNECFIQSPPRPCGSSSSSSSDTQDTSMPVPDLMEEDEEEESADHVDQGGKEEDPQQEQGYLYNDPIRLPIMHSTDYGSLPSLSFLASIVLFNLALSVQLGAMEEVKQIQYLTSDDGESILNQFERSIRLYEMGYEFQKEHDAPISTIVLATVNNLGQAYKAIGDYDTADKCFAHLLSMLMVFVSFNNDDYNDDGSPTIAAEAQEDVDVDDNLQLEEFFGNALPSMMINPGGGDNNDSYNKHKIYIPHAAAA